MKDEDKIRKKLEETKNLISKLVDRKETKSLQFERTVAKREELEWVLEN